MSNAQLGSEPRDAIGARVEKPTLGQRVRRALVGPPRPLDDSRLFHRVSLVALLAWVGLGADGLSSSAYGPEEAFRTLGSHTYLALLLALVMAATVIVISIAYSRVIEHFPHGGGGYVVATKLLGRRAGVVSGSALLVDYVLTITISIAAAGDALFSFLPPTLVAWKLPCEAAIIVAMIVLNLRGVRESVLVLAPIFFLFVITHAVLIGWGFIGHWDQFPATMHAAGEGLKSGVGSLGLAGIVLLFLHAYSLGGGTYTGIEAVSNGLAIMREPHVATGKRTMLYMAASLAITASGILVLYLLWNVAPVEGKTLNAVLAEKIAGTGGLASVFVVLVLLAEGALLVVAAQAGFVDGPRVLANMAVDSWVPRRFAALSDRLTAQNGVLLMGVTALGALILTRGDVRYLVVMYSINVFLTFSMTELSMCRLYVSERAKRPDWKQKIWIHAVGLTMCTTILGVTVYEKFLAGGWITLVITVAVIAACFGTRWHYSRVSGVVREAFAPLERELPAGGDTLSALKEPVARGREPDPSRPTAVVLVTSFGGLGIHTFLNALRMFPKQFEGVVFVSVGVIDSGGFKGADSMESLRGRTHGMLERYCELARTMGMPAAHRLALGTDAVEEAEKLCRAVAAEYQRPTFFAGHLLFQRETWLTRILHNQTAYAIQRRLQWAGLQTVIVPARVGT